MSRVIYVRGTSEGFKMPFSGKILGVQQELKNGEVWYTITIDERIGSVRDNLKAAPEVSGNVLLQEVEKQMEQRLLQPREGV